MAVNTQAVAMATNQNTDMAESVESEASKYKKAVETRRTPGNSKCK